MNSSNPSNSTNSANSTILLTFDVEDWFQVENFKKYIPFSSWPQCELRVEKNVHKILDLLDSIKLSNPTNSIDSTNSINPIASRLPPNGKDSLCAMPAYRKVPIGGPSAPCDLSLSPSALRLASNAFLSSPCAMRSAPCGTLRSTFFVLGWLAERLPHLVREIQVRGHEVASHGYGHELCKRQLTNELRVDLVRSKELLEDITGNPIYGYRAPNFSINHDILKIVEDSGYLYDSSFNSFKLNRRYGQLDLEANSGSNGISLQISDKFYELPISNLRIGKQTIPWGGGGYFRLIPLFIFKQGVQKMLKKHGAYLFYMHPWEIDSDQPKVSEIPGSFKFRHYVNLEKTFWKLSVFLEFLKNHCFSTCIEYINRETQQTQ